MSSASSACAGSMPNCSHSKAIAVRVGLGPKSAGVDVVEIVEMVVDADRLEHPAGIRRIAVGEDEAAAGQPRQQPRQPLVALHPVERDVVNVVKEVVRIDVMILHQPGERRPMRVEMRLSGRALLRPDRTPSRRSI